MRSCSLLKLRAVGAAAVIMMAAIASSNAPTSAQTMGEYATTLGQSASFGKSIAPSLPSPAAYSNTVTGDDREDLDGSEGARAARCTRQHGGPSNADDCLGARLPAKTPKRGILASVDHRDFGDEQVRGRDQPSGITILTESL